MTEPKSYRSSYDPAVADGFLKTNDRIDGLAGYLGLRFAEFGPGWLRTEMEVKPELLTPFGNMHGGVLAATCDHILGCVCYPHMKKGQWAATTEFKLNYLVPVSEGVVEALAEIVSLTRTTAVVRITVSNAERVVCVAQGTVLIRDPR